MVLFLLLFVRPVATHVLDLCLAVVDDSDKGSQTSNQAKKQTNKQTNQTRVTGSGRLCYVSNDAAVPSFTGFSAGGHVPTSRLTSECSDLALIREGGHFWKFFSSPPISFFFAHRVCFFLVSFVNWNNFDSLRDSSRTRQPPRTQFRPTSTKIGTRHSPSSFSISTFSAFLFAISDSDRLRHS